MESESNSEFIDHEVRESVVSFARSNPSGWFAASHIASKLNAPVDTVRGILVELTEQSRWLKAFLDYECPEHDFTLARKPVGESIPEGQSVTCSGDDSGHEVVLCPDHATIVFMPTETLAEYAKKG